MMQDPPPQALNLLGPYANTEGLPPTPDGFWWHLPDARVMVHPSGLPPSAYSLLHSTDLTSTIPLPHDEAASTVPSLSPKYLPPHSQCPCSPPGFCYFPSSFACTELHPSPPIHSETPPPLHIALPHLPSHRANLPLHFYRGGVTRLRLTP